MGPNVIGIGCAKAGTTSVARALAQSDEVFMARRKELHFFDREKVGMMDFAGYICNFPSSKKIRIEFTPSYLMDKNARFHIKKYMPSDTKFIVSLRDPVYRAYSHYCHAVKNWTPESHWVKRRGYPIETLSFEDALENEFERLVFDPWHMRHLSYFSKGLYHAQLERWMALFDRAQVHIIVFENLIGDAAKELNKLGEFLGIDCGAMNLPVLNSQSEGGLRRSLYDSIRSRYSNDLDRLSADFSVDTSKWRYIG